MKKEEIEFEISEEDFEEVGVPLEDHEKPESAKEDFDEVYSDEGVEELMQNDAISDFEEGFMRGYMEEAEEGA